MKPDQQRVHTMVTEAITMLCKNSLEFGGEMSVEGLLGITLDHREVFLINIKENIVRDPDVQDSSPRPSQTTTSQASNPVTTSHSGSSGSYPAPSPDTIDATNLIARAMLPMQCGFPFRRGRGRRRAMMEHLRQQLAESSVQEPTPQPSSFHGCHKPYGGRGGGQHFQGGPHHGHPPFPHHGPPAFVQRFLAAQSVGGGPPFKKAHMQSPESQPGTTTGQSMGKQAATQVSPSLMQVKQENPESDYTDSESEAMIIADDTNETQIIVEDHPVNTNKSNVSGAAIVPTTGTELNTTGGRPGGSAGSLQAAASPASSWADNMSDTSSRPSSANIFAPYADRVGGEISDYPDINDAMIERARSSILHEDGCFVTARMMCRRYSAVFKVNHVVQCMQFVTQPTGHPEHMGIYQVSMNERTKVFYKAPPEQVNPEFLAKYGLTTDEYKEIYFRMPKSKGIRGASWDQFVESVLNTNPYGQISLTALTQTVEPDRDEDTPVDSYEEFELQQMIVRFEGCFVSSRTLCRRITKQYRVLNVIRAMKAMSRERQDRHYVGEYVRVSERIKVFYKCPPDLLGSDALSLYGLSIEEYRMLYQINARPTSGSLHNWDSYVETVARKSPFGVDSFPLEYTDISVAVLNVLRQRIAETEPQSSSAASAAAAATETAPAAVVPPTTVQEITLIDDDDDDPDGSNSHQGNTQ